MTALLPCPFCGGKPTRYAKNPDARIGQVNCENDDCFGPRTPICNQADADQMWNRRTFPPAQASPVALQQILEALRPFDQATLTPTGHVVGLMREDFTRVRELITQIDSAIAAPPPAAPVEEIAKLGVAEVAEAWAVLENHGFPPEAVGWPHENIGGKLPGAIDSAITALVTAREDLQAEVLKLRSHECCSAETGGQEC